jgi:hypothetical protein
MDKLGLIMKREYTPFLRPQRLKDIDGIYRNKESGKLMLFKNVRIKGFIDCDKKPEEPYDAYQGFIHYEGMEPIKKCLIEPYHLHGNYELVFALN